MTPANGAEPLISPNQPEIRPGSHSLGIIQFDSFMERYPGYLRGQRGLSENTLRVYLADLASFRQYLEIEGLGLTDMDRGMLRGYLAWLATDLTIFQKSPCLDRTGFEQLQRGHWYLMRHLYR